MNKEVHDIYTENQDLKLALDQLVDGTFGDSNQQFKDLYNCLLFGDYGKADTYMVLRDFAAYMDTHGKMSKVYEDRPTWLKKAIMNTAMAGFFSSDRTIADYNEKIWKLTPIK